MPPCAASKTSHATSVTPISASASRERPRGQLEVPLVPRAAVEVDRLQAAQRVGVPRHHPHRVPGQPALPDVLDEPARAGVERQAHRAVLVRGERGRDAVDQHQVGIRLLAHRRARREVRPEPLEGAVVVAQGADGLAEVRDVAELVEGVAGVAGQAAEQVRAQHRRDHRAEAAAGLARDAAVRGRGQRAVAGVDERHHLVAEVGVVRAGARASRRTGCRRRRSTRRRRRRCRAARRRRRRGRRRPPGRSARNGERLCHIALVPV